MFNSGDLQVILSADGEEDVGRSIHARLLSSGLARYAPPRRKVCFQPVILAMQLHQTCAVSFYEDGCDTVA